MAVTAALHGHQGFRSFQIRGQHCYLLLTEWLLNLQHQVNILYSKTQLDLLTFGQDDSLLWQTVLPTTGCLPISTASTYQTLLATVSYNNQRCFQTLKLPLGVKITPG